MKEISKNSLEKLIGFKEAAEILGVPESSLRRHVQMKRITYTKIGRLVKFRPSDIKKYIDENTYNSFIKCA